MKPESAATVAARDAAREAARAAWVAADAARDAAAEKAEKEKSLLTSDAFLQHMWALTQGSSERDAIAAMRTFMGATLR